MRIAELLNDIGEIDEERTDAASALALGRSVSAPARSSSGDSADRELDVDMDDEHSSSCPEDRKRGAASSGAFATRKRSKSTVTRSASALTAQPFMAISRLVSSPEATADSSSATTAVSSGKKRSTRALFPAVSDADRRAKQRLIVKRCYYKKIVRSAVEIMMLRSLQMLMNLVVCLQNTIKTLREEVEELEESFRAALRTRQAQDASAVASGDLSEEDLRLRSMYVETLDVKDSLRKENHRLRRLADEYYMKNQGRLRQLLDSNHKVRLSPILFIIAMDQIH